MKIAIVTCEQLPQLTEEDQTLARALMAKGHQVEACIWSAPRSWRQYDLLIIRSVWDYHRRVDEFLTWINTVKELNLLNDPQVVLWNYQKSYLKELTEAGFHTIPTLWFEANQQPHLEELLRQQQWSSAIMKPVVGATAYQTLKLELADLQDFDWNQRSYPFGFMVQKYMEEISTQGEWSHVFFNKVYSHSVLKTAKSGDFRVQGDFGGQKELLTPPMAYVHQCQRVLDHLPCSLLYARVDGLHLNGQFHIMEVELIEPELFLWNDSITRNMVNAIETLV